MAESYFRETLIKRLQKKSFPSKNRDLSG